MRASAWLKFALPALLTIAGFTGCVNKPLYKDTRVLMGTFIEVISRDKKAAQIVFDEFRRIDGLLSKYKADSEVSELNRLGKLRVSDETFFIIKKSIEFYALTNGAFDITTANLVELWGFSDRKYRVPATEQIIKTLKATGSDKIILKQADNMVEFKIPGIKIDLGAIAKGFALDCAVKKLKENKISNCLIDAGGQVYCLGDNYGRPWRVAVKNPRKDSFTDYMELRDKSASTSGDYEQYFVSGNKRYSHILNPKTGYPADSGLASVTVVAADGMTADALSTAIFVLGREKWQALAKIFPDAKVRLFEEENVSDNK